AGVQAHPDCTLAVGERPLPLRRAGHRARSPPASNAERISLPIDPDSAVAAERPAQRPPTLPQRSRVPRPPPVVPPPRGAPRAAAGLDDRLERPRPVGILEAEDLRRPQDLAAVERRDPQALEPLVRGLLQPLVAVALGDQPEQVLDLDSARVRRRADRLEV